MVQFFQAIKSAAITGFNLQSELLLTRDLMIQICNLDLVNFQDMCKFKTEMPYLVGTVDGYNGR
ncbi:hypothetical protein TorRG33x02_325780 [Trema orientale]|uniref:Uncharacterized protein n=1 Tax=Trema orientale TaxID=63057 RepID=A0A2P5BCF6_TREOI|nr:hypothetical protein TorRG33x02_325780 [Trema orientale]